MAYFVSLWVAQSLSLLLYTTKRAIIPLNDIIVHGRRHWRMCPLVQNSGGISAPQKSERKKEKNQKEKEKIRNQKPRNQKPKSLDLSIFPNQSGQNLRRNQNLVVGGFDSPESAPPLPSQNFVKTPVIDCDPSPVHQIQFSGYDTKSNCWDSRCDVTTIWHPIGRMFQDFASYPWTWAWWNGALIWSLTNSSPWKNWGFPYLYKHHSPISFSLVFFIMG